MILETIKMLCKENNITVTELERILEFGNGTMHKWEKTKPSIDKISKVAKYFDVSIDYLVMFDTNFPTKETLEFAKAYNSLSNDKKKLVKCYISIIKTENQQPSTCTNHSS